MSLRWCCVEMLCCTVSCSSYHVLEVGARYGQYTHKISSPWQLSNQMLSVFTLKGSKGSDHTWSHQTPQCSWGYGTRCRWVSSRKWCARHSIPPWVCLNVIYYSLSDLFVVIHNSSPTELLKYSPYCACDSDHHPWKEKKSSNYLYLCDTVTG